MAGQFQADSDAVNTTVAEMFRFGDALEARNQDLRGLWDAFQNDGFQGNARTGLREAMQQFEGRFGNIMNVTAALRSRLAKFAERLIAADTEGGANFASSGASSASALGVAVVSDAAWFTGDPVRGGISPMNAAQGMMDTPASDAETSGIIATLEDATLNGKYNPKDSSYEFRYGLEGALWERETEGEMTIGGIPLSGTAGVALGTGELSAGFSYEDGKLKAGLFGEAYAAKVYADGTLGSDEWGLAGSGEAKAAGGELFVGMKDDAYGVGGSLNAGSVEANVGTNIAGINMGGGIEVGAKIGFGLSAEDGGLKVDLPIFSVSAKPPDLTPASIGNALGDAVGGDAGDAIATAGTLLGAAQIITNPASAILNPVGAVETVGKAAETVVEGVGDAAEAVGDFISDLNPF